MPSFDIVSEVELHELRNAVDQANREISTRFDFKGVEASFELGDAGVTMRAEVDFQLKQMLDILRNKMSKRSIDQSALDIQAVQLSGKAATQLLVVQQGIETATAKKMVKAIKDAKMKVQAAIQGEKVRVTGKKRDDLQQVISMLKEGDYGLPLQFNNFRD